jgi:formylglycine-generating enzyme required for sulfatase activity
MKAGVFEGVEAQRWEAPQPLAFAQTPITRGLYEELMGPAPSLGEPLPSLPFGAPQAPPVSDERLPVSKLSWLSATRLCNALSANRGLPPYFKYLTPQGEALKAGESPSEAEFEAGGWLVCADERAQGSFRLPTSAEWCYAASAGHATPYAGGDDPERLAWSAHNSGSKLHPVASLQPNAWGLYDMSGLLWEWCEDGARDADLKALSAPEGLRPLCASATQPKWLLGGSWANHPWVFPLGERLSELPTYADEFMGVRVVCGLGQKKELH